MDCCREVTAATLASLPLGRSGGFLVGKDLVGGAAVGCSVALVADRMMAVLMIEAVWEAVVMRRDFGVTVAGTDLLVFTESSCPTEMHRTIR